MNINLSLLRNPFIKVKPIPKKELHLSLLPIIIGVTGHRDLIETDIPELEAKVKEIFAELQKKYPSTPFQLLSPLAEGADRLVAKVALELKMELIAPLPMPRTEYENDFETPESKNEFSQLLDKAQLSFELPFTKKNTPEKIRTNPGDRNKQYTQVGVYIAERCHILLALWDGFYNDVEGGSSNIIRIKLGDSELQTPSNRILDTIDIGPVYHLVTPRKKNPIPRCSPPFVLNKHFPGGTIDDPESDKLYHQILKRTDDFNKDAIRLGTKDPDAVLERKCSLIDLSLISKLTLSCRTLLERYATTDALAVKFQKKRRRTMIGLFLLVGVAVVCMENYDGFAESIPWLRYLLAIYLGALGLAYLWHFCAKSWGYQTKHLEYRSLAEGLRVQFFWELAGINQVISKEYSPKQAGELERIRNAFRLFNDPEMEPCSNTEENPLCNYWLILRHWVNSQKQYYQDSAHRDKQKTRRLELIMNTMIFLGILLAVTVFIIDLCNPKSFALSYHKTFRIIMQVLPALGAAFGGYAMKMALAEQAKKYERMYALYSQASKDLYLLIKRNDFKNATDLLHELGKASLSENGDWIFLHQEREMEVPMGG